MEGGSGVGGSRSMKERLDSSPVTGNLKASSTQVNQKPVTSVGSKWKEIEHPMREESLRLREVN